MKKVFLVAVLLALSPLARASDIYSAPPPGINLNQLFVLTNDRDDKAANVSLMVDGKQNVAGVYIDALSFLYENTANNVFWLKDIESDEGALLMEQQGYKLAFLQGQLDRSSQEGRFHLRYLANGLTHNYKTCDFDLKKNGPAWYVQNAYDGQPVTNVKVVTWSLGIKTLEGVCPEQNFFEESEL